MNWFDNIARGLGTANAPFGFGITPNISPSQDDPALYAGKMMLSDVGMRMLANGGTNPAQAFGQAYIGAQDQARTTNKENFAAQQMMQQAEEARMRREEENKMRAARNKWLQSVSDPNQRALLEAYPGLVNEYVQANDPAFQTADTSSPEFGLNPIALQDENGNFAGWGQMSKSGGLFIDGKPVTGSKLRPMDPLGLNQQKAAGSAIGKEMGGAAVALPGAAIDTRAINDKIDMLIENPDLGSAIGYGNAIGDYFVGNNVLQIRSMLNELEGGAFLSAYSSLKGGGQITEIESAQAKQAIADMQTARKMSNVDMFKAALNRFRDAVNRGYQKLQAQAGSYAPSGGGAQSGATRYRFNPKTGELE